MKNVLYDHKLFLLPKKPSCRILSNNDDSKALVRTSASMKILLTAAAAAVIIMMVATKITVKADLPVTPFFATPAL